MAEKIYAIPVNDTFDRDCECPVCLMYESLEQEAIDFTLGPSYMDDQFRMITNRTGFCKPHMQKLYDKNNRLGLALMMKTHMDETNRQIQSLQNTKLGGGLFKKASGGVVDYVKKLNHSCFVCDRVNAVFDRYIATVHYLWKTDNAFVSKYKKCKGFCTEHYGRLLEDAPKELSGKTLDEFVKTTHTLYLENMLRVADDVEWFINKFDYRFKDEPWKNGKDAVIRGMIKTNGIVPEDMLEKK